MSETPSTVADEASPRVERAPPPVGPTVAVGSSASTIFFVTQKLNSNLDGIGEQGTNPAISGSPGMSETTRHEKVGGQEKTEVEEKE